MATLIEDKREDVRRLCERFHVRRLELFGSAADGTFDAQRSDLDFLVEFQPLGPGQHFDSYFALLEGLEQLFQRRVDLVVARAVRNPYFQRSIDQSRTLVYAA